MKRILVTGGSGFFGRNLVPALSKAYTVFAPTHKQLDIVKSSDLVQFVKQKKIDGIVHAATATGVGYFEPTIMMFRSIIEVSSLLEKVIYYGSGAEYGKSRDLVKVKENEFGRMIPDEPNGLSKYINCMLSEKTSNIYVLRVFGVYGPNENYAYKFISNTIVKHLFGLPIIIKQNAIFDYVHIDNVITVTKEFLEKNVAPKVFNLTADTSISLLDIAHMVNAIGKKQVSISVATKGLNYQYTGDNSLLRKALPDLRFYSYKKGIQQLYEHYKARISELDKKSVEEDAYFRQAAVRRRA